MWQEGPGSSDNVPDLSPLFLEKGYQRWGWLCLYVAEADFSVDGRGRGWEPWYS